MAYEFFSVFGDYVVRILPPLAIGFLLSGLIYEFVPGDWVEKRLGQKGVKPIFYASLVGTILPICCIGALPVALSFYKKGARLGPVLAFLVATPATSVSALLVAYQFLGIKFTIYIFFAVIFIGLFMGIIGNLLKVKLRNSNEVSCEHCAHDVLACACKKSGGARILSALKFAFVDMPKEIGLELILGLVLAAAVTVVAPIGNLIRLHLASAWGYLFGLVFGLIMYICSTASVPLVDAFIKQGLNLGGGMVLLLVGPITSYGTILVLRKEFGLKVLGVYLATICILSLVLGYIFYIIFGVH